MSGGVAPGWYPDYEAPPGHERYWDGERWTERRSNAPSTVTAGPRLKATSWLIAAAAVLVLVSAVVILFDDHEAPSSSANSPLSGRTHESPSAGPSSTASPTSEQQTWAVAAVIDGSTIRLSNGAEVRLVGIVDHCGADELTKMLVGHQVTLIRRGPDQDSAGRLLRYVERGNLDVGKRLIQMGLATASDEPNARRTIYQAVDARTPDRCG